MPIKLLILTLPGQGLVSKQGTLGGEYIPVAQSGGRRVFVDPYTSIKDSLEVAEKVAHQPDGRASCYQCSFTRRSITYAEADVNRFERL